MSTEVYEVIAQAMRYWFLFLMALIVWRCYRWYRRDRRQRKKRLRLLPDAGYVGELVVTDGGGVMKDGEALPVPREGTLGFLRTNDLCVPVDGVKNKHLWFRFDEDEGLVIEPYSKNKAEVDGEQCASRSKPLYMAHGSRLRVGEAELRLRLFAGFESAARAPVRDVEDERGGGVSGAYAVYPPLTYAQAQAYWQAQWQSAARAGAYAQPQTLQSLTLEQYRQVQLWIAQNSGAAPADYADDDEYDEVADESDYDADVADDETEYAGEARSNETVLAPEGSFYPPVGDASDDDTWPYAPYPPDDDDMTDAIQPPRSAYIGHDDAELAKKKVWDRYLGGGRKR